MFTFSAFSVENGDEVSMLVSQLRQVCVNFKAVAIYRLFGWMDESIRVGSNPFLHCLDGGREGWSGPVGGIFHIDAGSPRPSENGERSEPTPIRASSVRSVSTRRPPPPAAPPAAESPPTRAARPRRPRRLAPAGGARPWRPRLATAELACGGGGPVPRVDPAAPNSAVRGSSGSGELGRGSGGGGEVRATG